MPERYYLILGIGIVTFLLLPPAESMAQLRYGVSSSVYAAEEDQLPFWLYANTDGMVEPSGSNFINRFYTYFSEQDSSDGLDFAGGFDAFARLSDYDTLVFTELFADLRYGGLTIRGGRFYDPMGLHDRDLSMGSMLVSRNAIPVPKIRVGTSNFVSVPRSGDHLQFKAMISHGWFTDERYIENPYLHQKFFYLRYKHRRFDLTAGAAHNTVWGGIHPGVGNQAPYELPSSFSDYLDVVLGQSASGNNVPWNEISNSVGNSVAAYEAKVGVNFNHFRLQAYRLFYLEDKVALSFRSPWDGMWGAGVTFDDSEGWVTKVLWEHLNTKRQNAWINTPWGRTNYYNNGVYRSGWSHEGRVLGNPLIINGPVSDFDGGTYPISNNIIIAHHVGIQGRPGDRLFYKALLTYSRNYGTNVDQGERPYTPLDELRVDEYSSLLRLKYRASRGYGVSLIGSLALDLGALYEGRRLGFQVGVAWEGKTQ
ncbi:capsule assembly Wzi family protein [Fodinibius sediminis]|uniref:Capsule assembly protein Wzi n=1 Tax=Fodinibius sediminis TaxID=1214077 RepID=A0A521B846_9BACT|nr:capsule assembly Wzi family protein [Fodinibius sediminis]SMO42860.1 Capsule assembly protein Wzi [Fodinibius sediminis]